MNKYMVEIYETVLPEMAAHGIEDTTPNRIAFLSGLLDGWLEDESRSAEKSIYVSALALEIFYLKLTQIRSMK